MAQFSVTLNWEYVATSALDECADDIHLRPGRSGAKAVVAVGFNNQAKACYFAKTWAEKAGRSVVVRHQPEGWVVSVPVAPPAGWNRNR